MEVVLVPGLWLDASSWREVELSLAAAGHTPRALSLRGFESRVADRSGIQLADHVAEIAAAIDRADEPVVLVGQGEACGLVHAAVNRRPERVAHAVHVGGFPSAAGTQVLSGFTRASHDDTVRSGTLPVIDPALSPFLDRARANAAYVLDSPQRLTDDRRFEVPATVVATQCRADDIRRWMLRGLDPVRELTRMTDLTLVDLPSGPWPQMEAPDELARLVTAAVAPPHRAIA